MLVRSLHGTDDGTAKYVLNFRVLHPRKLCHEIVHDV
jgi:hypothetical protein